MDRFFLVYLNVQSALCFYPDGIHRTRSGLTRPRERRSDSVFLPAALAHRICPGQDCPCSCITLSWITWVPGLVLFVVQASLAGWRWMKDNLWIADAIVWGSLVWISVAVSALAGALRLGAMADRGRRAAARRVLRGRGFRASGERRAAHQAGLSPRSSASLCFHRLAGLVRTKQAISRCPVTEAWIACSIVAGLLSAPA